MKLAPFKLSIGMLAAVLLFGHAAPSRAHHSGEMFEPEKTVTLQGVVKEFRYINPHSWLIVDVAKDDGTTETWGFEAEGPSVLMRRGVFKSDLQPGDKITVTARPMRDGRPAGIWSEIVKEDGTVLDWRTEGRD